MAKKVATVKAEEVQAPAVEVEAEVVPEDVVEVTLKEHYRIEGAGYFPGTHTFPREIALKYHLI
jgi:hypothetical protein